jgi:hypothetical protein
LLIILMVMTFVCSYSQQNQKTKSFFSNSGESSFTIIDRDSDSIYTYKIVETDYKLVYIALNDSSKLNYYFAKYTTTSESNTNSENENREIEIEVHPLDNPERIDFKLKESCDDIVLGTETFTTKEYACCGGEDKQSIYDYNKKLIIKGNEKIISGGVPNSRLKIYIAWENDDSDETTIGTLHYSYNSTDKYDIKVKGILPSDSCTLRTPEISIITSNSKDEFNNETNEYTLWSLNGCNSKASVNNITIQIVFDCDYKQKKITLSVPIIKGKPFGKEYRQQIVFLK